MWVPNETTRLRREVFFAHNQAVKDSTRARLRIRSFLNQYRVRLDKGFELTAETALEGVLKLRDWRPTQIRPWRDTS